MSLIYTDWWRRVSGVKLETKSLHRHKASPPAWGGLWDNMPPEDKVIMRVTYEHCHRMQRRNILC
jgi:hypothetical protein